MSNQQVRDQKPQSNDSAYSSQPRSTIFFITSRRSFLIPRLGTEILRTFPYVAAAIILLSQWQGVLATPLLSAISKRQPTPVQQEIQCYALPYGGIGFTSHILTFYTIWCLWFEVRPLWPAAAIEVHWWDFVIGSVSLVATVALSTLTMFRCRHHWQLVVIAFWKLCLSATVGANVLLNTLGPGSPNNTELGWSSIYVIGVVVGITGIGSLANENWDTIPAIPSITYAFSGFWIGLVFLTVFLQYAGRQERFTGNSAVLLNDHAKTLFISLVVFLSSLALYSDWILGGVAGNWSGEPSGDIAILYWAYFLVKRLPMTSL